MPRILPIGQQRDCRKNNSSARRDIDGIVLQSNPRKGWSGYWMTDNQRVVLRQKRMREAWSVLLDGKLVGSPFENFNECVRSNAWIIRKGLQ